MNKVYLIGNLTRDPELSETSNGISVCRFSIAVNRSYPSGNDSERITDFFNITVWRTRGETCHRYLRKGNKVAVVGEIQIRSYDDKDGIKRQAVDIIANEVEFLTPRNSVEGAENHSVAERPISNQSRTLQEVVDDELPF